MNDIQEAADDLHKLVLARIECLMGAEPGTPEAAELDTLSKAVERYETIRWPIAE